MSGITRYENRAKNMHDLDPDMDGKLEVGTTSDRPVYGVNCNTRFGIWIWFKAGLKLLWIYPFSMVLFLLTIRYVIYPIVTTAPVALLRNNPKVLTEKEAGGELNALINNTVVNARDIGGSVLDSAQDRQIKVNTENSDRRPELTPKARVTFIGDSEN